MEWTSKWQFEKPKQTNTQNKTQFVPQKKQQKTEGLDVSHSSRSGVNEYS